MNEAISTEPCLRIGRYELFDELASGGMATVHIGRLKGAVGFSRMVAIKRLHNHLLRDRQFVTMFVDEARLAARIRHPNVVPILDVVQTNEELFLVMDYVQGASLARAAALGRKHQVDVPVKVAAAIAASVLHGLHAAHEAKDDRGEPLHIVHRDVSPQNVIVGADGVARVLDFGIAKARGRLQDTAEGVVKGKVAYMAPEQIGGADLGPEADIYAVGVILWELLAGRRLHAAATQTLVLASVLKGAKDPPSEHRAGIPEALDRLVMRALALESGARFSTARDFALAIEDATPLASAAQIARWLEQVADEVLARSAVMVASVDSRPRSFADIPLSIETMITPANGTKPEAAVERTAVSVRPEAPASDTAPALAAPEASKRALASRVAQLGVAMALAAALAVAVVQWRAREGQGAPAAASAALPPAPTPSISPPAPAPSAEATVVAEVAAAPATATAIEAARASLPSRARRAAPAHRHPPARPPSPPAPPAAAARPAAAKLDCDPPYTLDSRGIQRLKPHCL
jgi:eukaryotic-like serine/threonine-protein kinase